MKFLVLFLALLAKWRLPLPQFELKSRSVARWQRGINLLPWVRNNTGFLAYFFMAVFPVLVIAPAFYYADRYAWGLPSFFLETGLLIYILLHVDVSQHLQHYRERLQQNDLISAYQCAERHLALPYMPINQGLAMNDQVIRALLMRWFENFFFVVFWYLVADVAGLLLAWLTVQFSYLQPHNKFTEKALHWLGFIPARVLAITFGLAGNLLATLPTWKEQFFNWKITNADFLFIIAEQAVAADSQKCQQSSETDDINAALCELKEWEHLHLRCLSILMVMVAVATLGGWLV